jgi:uncharacterized protein (TIGR03086 family)
VTGFGAHDDDMTTTNTTTDTTTATNLTADDPRLALAKAVVVARPIFAGVRADQMTNATPCDDFDVRQLLGHVLFALNRIAVVGRDGDATAVPPAGDAIADDGWAAALDTAAHDVQTAWLDPAELEKMKVLPFATLPARVALAIYTSEVTVHTWDLARATGQQPAWDDGLVANCLAGMRMALPAEPRGGELPFAAVVEVPADAPLIDQLVGWVGRRP